MFIFHNITIYKKRKQLKSNEVGNSRRFGTIIIHPYFQPHDEWCTKQGHCMRALELVFEHLFLTVFVSRRKTSVLLD